MTCGSIGLNIDLYIEGLVNFIPHDIVVYYLNNCQALV